MKHPDLFLGELREFKRSTIEWQQKVDKKLDSFNAFRMKLIGMATLASFTATSVVTVVIELMRN